LALDGSEWLFSCTSHVTHEERTLDLGGRVSHRPDLDAVKRNPALLGIELCHLAHSLVAIVTELSQKFYSDFNKVFLLFYSYGTI
jgi:hypothetical protein